MELRRFGRTDMRVSALGFGAGEIGSPNLDDQSVTDLLHEVLDAGVNVIDTAACYGLSEERIGRALVDRREDVYLFTKCGHTAGLHGQEWTPALMERSVERSLRRLGTDRLDLIQLHTCSEQMLRQGDVVETLQRLRDAGKARYIGYSGDRRAARYALECGAFDALQISLNIAEQEPIELLLPVAREKGVGVIAKRPLANVIWHQPERPESSYTRPYWDRLQELDYDFLRDREEAIATALRFTLSTPGVNTAIVGTTNIEHFRQNLRAASEGPLPPEQYEAIRERWKGVAPTGSCWV